MSKNYKRITGALSGALILGILLSLGRAVSIPARSAYDSPYFSVSVNTLSENTVNDLSANRMRVAMSRSAPENTEDTDGTWTTRTYREYEISLPADSTGQISESIKSKGRIAGNSGVSFSSRNLTRMAEVIDASNELMK